MALLRLTHIGICVADLERSLAFYRDLLGFAHRSDLRVRGEPSRTLLRLPDVDLQAVYLERDGVCIELLHFAAPGTCGADQPRAMNARGLTHLSLRVDDLVATLGALRAGGVRVLEETVIHPRPGAAAAFICDPDGTLVELVQSPG